VLRRISNGVSGNFAFHKRESRAEFLVFLQRILSQEAWLVYSMCVWGGCAARNRGFFRGV
jgi:hypothetical protein